jgi:hypothetical protein
MCGLEYTLLAGFVLSFSKIRADWALVALMLATFSKRESDVNLDRVYRQ